MVEDDTGEFLTVPGVRFLVTIYPPMRATMGPAAVVLPTP